MAEEITVDTLEAAQRIFENRDIEIALRGGVHKYIQITYEAFLEYGIDCTFDEFCAKSVAVEDSSMREFKIY